MFQDEPCAVPQNTSMPPWERAHRELDSMREGLLKAREEAQMRGRQAEADIASLDAALNRILPPVPLPIVNSGVGSVMAATPKPW